MRIITKAILPIIIAITLAGCEPTFPSATLIGRQENVGDGPSFDISDDDGGVGVITDATEVLVLEPDKRYAASNFKVKTQFVQLQVYKKYGDTMYPGDNVRVSMGNKNPNKNYGSFDEGYNAKHYEMIVQPAKTLQSADYYGFDGTPTKDKVDFSSGNVVVEWFINIDGMSDFRSYGIAVVATPGNAR